MNPLVPIVDGRPADIFLPAPTKPRLRGPLAAAFYAAMFAAVGLFAYAAVDVRPAPLSAYTCVQSGEWDGREICEILEFKPLAERTIKKRGKSPSRVTIR